MKDNLLIIGAGGHGKVVADIAKKMNRWKRISFLDDNNEISQVLGLKVIGRTDDLPLYIDNHDIFIAIGNNKIRETFHNKVEKFGGTTPILIHPSAIIAEQVTLNIGTVIVAGTVINCNTIIGKGCIINTGATVDHDNHVGDFVHISPGVHIGGNVEVGKGTWLGLGSKIINNVRITSNSIVGAGAVVLKDIYEPGTYVGVPARRINDGKNLNISK